MIKSFSDKEAEKLFNRERSRKVPQDIQAITRRKLEMIHAAGSLQDLRNPPSNHLERLKGELKNKYSIRINDQWRICFYWNDGEALNVEIVDYH